MPLGSEAQFKDQLTALFDDHRDLVSQHFADEIKSDFRNSFFQPRFYFVFSPFDLAVISLINDFEFPTQTFQPYHPYWAKGKRSGATGVRERAAESAETGSFYHQVIIGPMPKFRLDNDSVAVQRAHETFLSNQPLPLMAVCQLKLNNELLIGTGADFLRCVIKAVRRRFSEESKRHELAARGHLQMVMLESTAWSELTLILFSTSYSPIARFLLELRAMTVSRLKRTLYETDPEDWQCFWALLTERMGGGADRPSTLSEFAEVPVFMNTTTRLGFRFELFEGQGQHPDIKPIDPEDKVCAFARFLTAPAHLGNVVSQVVGLPLAECSDKILLCAGRGDFVYPSCGADVEMEPHPSIPMSTAGLVKMVTHKFRAAVSARPMRDLERPGWGGETKRL